MEQLREQLNCSVLRELRLANGWAYLILLRAKVTFFRVSYRGLLGPDVATTEAFEGLARSRRNCTV